MTCVRASVSAPGRLGIGAMTARLIQGTMVMALALDAVWIQFASASSFNPCRTSCNRICVALSGSSNSGLWAEFSNA